MTSTITGRSNSISTTGDDEKFSKSTTGYHRLKATADSLAFTQWSRFFFQKGTKDYGRLAELWIPTESRTDKTAIFHPATSKPVAPSVTLEDLRAESNANLKRYESICDSYFEEENWRTTSGAAGSGSTNGPSQDDTGGSDTMVARLSLSADFLADPNSPPFPHRELSAADLAYRSALAKRDFDKASRDADRRLKWLQVEDRIYQDKRRRYDELLKTHDQWVALLKGSIDPHEASLLLSKRDSFCEMIDELNKSCNSRCKLDMHNEWERNWARTEQVFPIDLVLWNDLRDRYFAVYDGTPADLESRLAEIFKRRFLAVVPWDDSGREYGPLAVSLQAEKMGGTNLLSTGALLETIEGIERAKAYDSEKIHKVPKRKVITANSVDAKLPAKLPFGGNMKCPVHLTGNHTLAECSKIRQAQDEKFKRVKFNDGIRKPPVTTKKRETKKKPTVVKNDRLDSLETMVKTLLTRTPPEAPVTKPVQILKATRKLFYLNNFNDTDLISNPVILDSGASRHVAPHALEMTDIKEVHESMVIIDATNNSTKIQYSGSLCLETAGERTIFCDVLVCDKVSNILISCAAWLENTDAKIILDDQHAFLQKVGNPELHEIARVVNGTYYMYPLKTMRNHRWDLKSVVNAFQDGRPSPIPIYSKVGTGTKTLRANKEDLKVLSNPAFRTQKTPCDKQLSPEVRALMFKTRSNKPTPNEGETRIYGAGLDKYLMKIHTSFGHSSFPLILSTLRCCGEVNKRKFKIRIFLTF